MLSTWRPSLCLFSIFLAAAVCSAPLHAQFQNPITAAKDAYNKARQQQQQQQQQNQNGQKPPGNGTQPQGASSQQAGSAVVSAPDGSCCTAEAMKKIAAQSGPDIVGIRVGMTPQEGVAAIKAHNPGLKLYQVNLRLEHPGSTSFEAVPHEIVACNNCSGRAMQVGAEVIVLELTPPPNPPLVAVVTRYTNFEPTLSANLVSGLEKKYGAEYPGPDPRAWLYDASGKVVTAQSEAAKWCASGQNMTLVRDSGGWAGTAHGGSYPEQGRDDGSMNIDSFAIIQRDLIGVPQAPQLGEAPCMPYTLVTSDMYMSNGPNMQKTSVFVRMASGGLIYAAQRATHDWLQAEADAKVKAAHDAAAQRTGTTF